MVSKTVTTALDHFQLPPASLCLSIVGVVFSLTVDASSKCCVKPKQVKTKWHYYYFWSNWAKMTIIQGFLGFKLRENIWSCFSSVLCHLWFWSCIQVKLSTDSVDSGLSSPTLIIVRIPVCPGCQLRLLREVLCLSRHHVLAQGESCFWLVDTDQY